MRRNKLECLNVEVNIFSAYRKWIRAKIILRRYKNESPFHRFTIPSGILLMLTFWGKVSSYLQKWILIEVRMFIYSDIVLAQVFFHCNVWLFPSGPGIWDFLLSKSPVKKCFYVPHEFSKLSREDSY